ncbi:MAG: DEAD/DEAH box helicase [Kiritimatiellae bacterium]|nr:DEAD/DEAH box helicase [Kiritimatiellia bacterium]
MVFLHLYRDKGKWYLWGETAEAVSDALSLFDVGGAYLKRLLAPWFWERGSVSTVEIDLPLPTAGRGKSAHPVPSQPFLAEMKGLAAIEEGKPHPVKRWPVHAIPLNLKQLMMLLNRSQDRRLDDGLFAGESLLILADLFKLAGGVVAQGRYLPGIRTEPDGTYTSVWIPILNAVDRKNLQALGAALPALVTDGLTNERAAQTILDELTDGIARSAAVTTLSEVQARKRRFYSAHDAWFAALRSTSPTIHWDYPDELADLKNRLAIWRYPVAWQQQTGTSLAFKLDFPKSPDDGWPLQILIQEGNVRRPFPADLNRTPVTRALLLALGQAALLFPPLACAEADETLGGYGCRLSSDEAYLFLNTVVRIFEGAGYGVELPEEGHLLDGEAQLIADVTSPTPPPDDAAHTMDEKLGVRWSVTLNGETLTAAEVADLLHAPSPLVCFRGKWIIVDIRKLQDALRAISRKSEEAVTAGEVVKYALGIQARNGLEIAHVRSDGWLTPFLRQLEGEASFEELPQPDTFIGTMRPYQLRGYSWLAFLRAWGFGACLADDMGLGKTIQALAFLLHEKAKGEKRPVLLVAPMSVLGNWIREAERFAPTLTCMLHHGSDRWHGDSFAREANTYDLVLTSYQLLHRDYRALRRVEWAGILLDEAQNIKNPLTRQSQAARALKAEYRIALTGTPIENHVGDIWSIMDFLNPGLLGGRTLFRKRFFQPIQSGSDPSARSRLRQMTTPFILRRLKTDKRIISDLPEKVESKVYCPLTFEQARLYQEVIDSFERDLEAAEGIQRRGLILAVLTKLKQVCNHPANYLGEHDAETARSGKLLRLEEMLDEIFARGECALIFTQYAEMGHLLQRRLCQTFAEETPFLHGGVARKERDRLVSAFQEGRRPQAFILSLKAGGTGLNLTRATHVFHFDRWWNPAVEDQATDRAFRIGQTHRVMVHKMICTGTLEERIDRMIEAKTDLANEIISHGETFLTELTNEALQEILHLQTGEELAP